MPGLQRIEIVAGATLTLLWEDGRRQDIPAARLRAACPCAACRGEHPVPDPAAVAVRSARIVGEYAVAFSFAPDGHGAGIYPFDLLAGLAA